jgi:hypothetical protein
MLLLLVELPVLKYSRTAYDLPGALEAQPQRLPGDPLYSRARAACEPHALRCRAEQQAYQALYPCERAAEQERDPEEAFAAIPAEPDLPYPQHDRPEAEHQAPHAPRPEGQRQDRGPL